jgi:hypothetical protein
MKLLTAEKFLHVRQDVFWPSADRHTDTRENDILRVEDVSSRFENIS